VNDVTVKPSAKLRLDYPQPTYKKVETVCPYSFLQNDYALEKIDGRCNMRIDYPTMDATIFLTYQQVKDSASLIQLLYDAQKLAYGHNIKAQSIPEQPFVNPENNAYGMFYTINGDAASQSQFYITDSIQHFVTGSLYFDAKPNFDSIFPAVQYIRNDMRALMETMEWK
jgi:gliding motility-associated lipoprotein GldD